MTRRHQSRRWLYHPAWSRAALAVAAAFALWCTWWSATCNVVRHHDFFGFVERAREFHFGRLSDWVDPLYPVGYPLLLRAVAALTGGYLAAGQVISVLAGMVWVLSAFLLARRFVPPVIAVLVQLAVAVHPQTQLYATKEGTDMAGAALCLLATAVLLSRASRKRWMGGMVGALLGLGYLVRYTTLLIVPAFLLCDWLAGRPKRTPWPMIVGFLLAASLQLVPSAVATGNPFWNGQARNVWFGLHDYDNYQLYWDRYPGTGLAKMVAEDPARFARHFADNLRDAVTTVGRQMRVPTPVLVGFLLWLLVWSGLRRRLILANSLLLIGLVLSMMLGLSLAFANRRLLLVVYPFVFVLLSAWWWHTLGGLNVRRLPIAWPARALALVVFVAVGGVPVHRLGMSHVEPWEELARLHRLQTTQVLRQAGVQRADQVASFCLGCQYLTDDKQIRRFVLGEALLGAPGGEGSFDTLRQRAQSMGVRFLCVSASPQDPYHQAYPQLVELFDPATRPDWLTPIDQAHKHLILAIQPNGCPNQQ
jgi:hypothetical protein